METRIYSFDMIKYFKKFHNNIDTRNIWEDNYPPKDFFTVNSKFETKEWIDLFYNYKKIDIQLENWMINLRKLADRHFNKDYFLEQFKKFFVQQDIFREIFSYDYSYYVMTEKGNLNNKLYDNIQDIILDLIVSDISEPLFSIYQKNIRLYLIEMEPFDKDDCFRLFITNLELRGVSQLYFYKQNMLLKQKSLNENEYISKLAHKISEIYFTQIYPTINTLYKSCVIDIRISDNFCNILDIKSNSKKYGTNSCLFSWIDDAHILENNSKKYSPYHFRVCF